MKNSGFVKGALCLIFAQTMVSINIVTSKIIVGTIPVLLMLLIRFALASLVLLPLHWLSPAKNESIKTHFSRLGRRDWGFIIAQSLCAGLLFNTLMLTGLNYTDANLAGIITSALPAIIALMSWLVLGEKISAQKGLCVAFACLGLMIIAGDKLKGSTYAHSFLGDFLVLLSLFPEATYYILCKLYTNRLPLFLTSSLLNGINAILLLPVLFFINHSVFDIPLTGWLILLLVGLGSGLFYVFWFIGASKVDGIMASLSTAVMPVATVILAWLILGEQLTVWQFIGMGMVVFSIVLYARN
ncbi:DMT family transporter [Legionella sp. CNM-4043-24]|uniref:DMT family transporter n=1 Tax=Legionella sp. CNM-4043-24 TaxID=3421646 RepID=UPI00403AD4AC